MLSSGVITLADMDDQVFILAIIGIGALVIWVLVHNIRGVLETRAHEQTRREIAAYMAEGSISADDAARVLSSDSSEAEKKIADAVAWGTVSANKAEGLIRAMREERQAQS